MDTPKVRRIPPGILVLVTALLMWRTSLAVPAPGLGIPYRELVALSLALAGVFITILGVVSFRRAGTTVNPLTPGAASALVRSGIYSITRNPMYLGFALLLLGWGIYLANALALLWVPAFLIYIDRFQIAVEESALTARYGQEYVAYTARVRRWL